ncbi:unknown protein [Spodoptera frugiperda multiple nucleopolyhedrovirus]|uniref:Orf4PE n=1 Tax=Spodoptera frugiperda nuclear polyhedrosis virus TaxID=10455 RepID=A1YJ05_NPVSF|nr:hypothetical protein SFMNPV_gp015 [Spodoptera frugiperda multiple nucleopolyhedrovirus]ABM45726.1 unknown protein [Spodoptera frugiperda multiple nucleopolyhedrovirus]ACA02572.1 unknown [Spodoptera frugiperda multiple nucleopolyhedrovirus]ADV91246.1 hypothetical protein Sf15 [Spodoptera frugiperda multiple nucleopolyhedrovirus]AFH58982.1 orf4PE [Spodoptera frugiperda multiple nucleopolyhedrovirus]AIW01425.1 hypothetical protein [Spodoptera frugiperda multiple nucleopolyhedrovirus]
MKSIYPSYRNMFYSSSPYMRTYRSCGNDTMMNYNNNHETLRHDLQTLKYQVYEMCQQSTTDRNLCDRIKSSIDTSSSSYVVRPVVPTTKTILSNNKKNGGGTVTVVDTVKY